MLKEKRGWIRIVEAVIAVLLIISVVIVFASKTIDKPDVSANMQKLEKAILDDLSQNSTMRDAVVSGSEDTESKLFSFIEERITIGLRNTFAVCVSEPANTCKPTINYDSAALQSKQVFVDDRIIFGSNGVTKKVSLFIWLK